MTTDEWVKKSVRQGKLLVEVPDHWSEKKRVLARRKVLEQLTGVRLSSLSLNEELLNAASSRNIEQAIGATSVPVGIVGPLRVRSGQALQIFSKQDLRMRSRHQGGQAKEEKEYFIPVATTEGALVASINRGCKSITQAGGAAVVSEKIGITRAPVFRVQSLSEGKTFIAYIRQHLSELRTIAHDTDRHLKLVHIEPKMVGRSVFLRFRFNTEEAMGMNMATIATDALSQHLEKVCNVSCVSLSSNYCIDKKPASLNFQSGRGYQVWAEIVLPPSSVANLLKTTVEKIAEVSYRKLFVGSALSNSLGFNAQYANIVAALFLATGQDIAHVVEGSMGITTVEQVKKGLYVSVFLPSLVLGTVGGGTGLPAQNEALQIMGLGGAKTGDSETLAEIVGATVLAGEISLLASLAEGSLARSHQRLGRNHTA